MRLQTYTNSKLTLLLLFLIGIWGVFFYFAIHHEIMDETDDMLRSYRDIFIKKALNDSTLLHSSYETTFDRYAIRPVTEAEAIRYEEQWTDREMFFPEENENIPVRVLKSVFLARDNRYYELEINMSTLERDDMIETLFRYLIALYVLLLLCIIIGNGIILKRAFAPLQRLLRWIQSVAPGKPLPSLDNKTPVTEFSRLNTAVWEMSQRNLDAYRQQKVFLENAAHELQTPLAVATNKIELLGQKESLNEEQLGELDEIYQTLHKAVRLNKSLLLLSRIENRQFEEKTEVNLETLIREIVADMNDIYAEKGLRVSIDTCQARNDIHINETLAQVLLSNLIKNAFVHTPSGGSIRIEIHPDRFVIRNTGEKPLDETKIFRRFYRSEVNDQATDSTGLGLAIVQSIAAANQMKVSYVFEGEHVFSIIV